MQSSPQVATESRGATAARIATGTVQLYREYAGRGPTKAHATINRDSVAVVLQDTLTKGERALVAAERAPEVIQTRSALQEIMRERLTALVEDNIERKVIAFLSADHVDPEVALEFFLLEPLPREADHVVTDGHSS
jgi:uncharacterized protein YbcI